MRKISQLILLLLLSVVLVACGSEDEEEPTPEPTAAEIEPTSEPDINAGTPEIIENDATPDAGGAAATPGMMDEATAVVVASTPIVSVADSATPEAGAVVGATPSATPMMNSTPVASPEVTTDVTPDVDDLATPDDAVGSAPPLVASAVEPTETPVVMVELSGMVVLNGVENEAYILTAEGCVGLGQHSGLREGRQVVVRNEDGTIVSVTEIGESGEDEGCAWDFVVQVPESDFYSISIPMMFEHVFPKGQVSENGGKVVIELP